MDYTYTKNAARDLTISRLLVVVRKFGSSPRKAINKVLANMSISMPVLQYTLESGMN